MHCLELDDKVCNVDKEHRRIAVIDFSSWIFSRTSDFVSEPSTWARDSSDCFQVLWCESQTVNVFSCLIALSTPPGRHCAQINVGSHTMLGQSMSLSTLKQIKRECRRFPLKHTAEWCVVHSCKIPDGLYHCIRD
jgi:hypothetical protein